MDCISGKTKINILSFDCGYKPLASCLVTIDLQYNENINNIISQLEIKKKILCQNKTTATTPEEKKNQCMLITQYLNVFFDRISSVTNNHIKLRFVKSDDIVPPGKKIKDTSTQQRMSYIKGYLSQLDIQLKQLDIVPDIILCENQRVPSKKIQSVETSILYHYTNKHNIFIVTPTLKNKIKLSTCSTLKHSTFIQKYSTNHRANKMHCKHNFLYWIKLFNLQDKISHINKSKHYEDIGDAFCQVLGWYWYEYPTL